VAGIDRNTQPTSASAQKFPASERPGRKLPLSALELLLFCKEPTQRSVTDEATQRRRMRNAVKQSGQLQVMLAHAAVVPAFLGSWSRFED
jgi:hypothetical protein